MKKYKYLIFCMLFLGSGMVAYAQETIEVTGIVVDSGGEPLIGVNISVVDVPGLGTVTDVEGKFKIKVEQYRKLLFSYVGFEKVEVLITDQRDVNVTLKESESNVLDQVVVVATGAQKKVTITGAVTSVDIKELSLSPTGSISNALAGNVPGVLSMQTSGQPGSNSEFWIRGISTFGASTAALVLVDGFERNMNEINVEDIESFTVLKDASATAIYGSKGANGVVLINTKRGTSGKINVDAKYESSYNMLTKVPQFVDGFQYAEMANEARRTRAEELIFQPDELELLRLGMDQDLYPNVDWKKLLLRKGAMTNRASVNLSGGGTTARYFVSGSFIDQQGMYKVDQTLKDYNTNANYRRWNYRMNVDVNVTKTTVLKVGVSGSLEKLNDPGMGSSALWSSVMGYNPTLTPMTYSNGYVPAVGAADFSNAQNNRINPWVTSTMTGYRETWKNNIQTNITLEQKLDFITEGLRFVGRFGYDTNNNNEIHRRKYPEIWGAERYRDLQGNIRFNRIAEELKMEQWSVASGNRNEFLEAEIHYDRSIKGHGFGGTAKYFQSAKIQTVEIGTDIKNGIALRNQGVAGRVNYRWQNRYFAEFNFGYTGSENFARGKKFGFFPAFSAAWNIADEQFIKHSAEWMNLLKIRYSWGKVGNDNLGGIRFPYLYTIQTYSATTGGYNFADIGFTNYRNGMRYSSVASPNVTWEVATKNNLGFDISVLNNTFSTTIDFFDETREGIYMPREFLSGIIGLESNPSANVGKVNTKGMDGNITFRHKFAEQLDFTLRGNMTVSRNEILERDEIERYYTYQMQKGHRVNQASGLIALGLFEDWDDIRTSPRQSYSDVMPGDIKYKDVNGDGIIDDCDIVAVGATTRPNLIYGMGASAVWKGFDLNVHFQGAGKSSYFINGPTVHFFSQRNWGNVLKELANSNRWISADISGDAATENPNADYPRLSYGGNSNNFRNSTFWLRDGSYLRLKTLEIGYTVPKSYINKIHINNLRVFFIGTNLLTWSKFDLWDPEMGSTNGTAYPLNKTFLIGLTVKL